MLKPIVKKSSIDKLRSLLENSEKIVITCHVSPDGDAIGSSLALARVLDNLGKSVKVITPDMPPRNLMFLPGAKEIVVFSRYESFATELLNKADLIFALDYNEPKRIDRMAPAFMAATAPKVLIDHHLNPDTFTDIVISHPEESSTSMLIFRVVCALELFTMIDREAATCIYTGMMTDTGNFSFNSNDPDIYTIIAELIGKGINKDAIYSEVFNSNSVSRLRLNGYALDRKMTIFEKHRAAIITLSREELNHYNYQKGDTESLVNKPLTVPEIVSSFFIREENGCLHVSARSKGDYPVNIICKEHFGGGGHLNAAGGEYEGDLADAESLLASILPQYDSYLPHSDHSK